MNGTNGNGHVPVKWAWLELIEDLDDPAVDTQMIAVAVALVREMDSTGNTRRFGRRRLLEARSHASPSVVISCLDQLERLGLLRVTRQPGQVPIYQAEMPSPFVLAETARTVGPRGARATAKRQTQPSAEGWSGRAAPARGSRGSRAGVAREARGGRAAPARGSRGSRATSTTSTTTTTRQGGGSGTGRYARAGSSASAPAAPPDQRGLWPAPVPDHPLARRAANHAPKRPVRAPTRDAPAPLPVTWPELDAYGIERIESEGDLWWLTG